MFVEGWLDFGSLDGRERLEPIVLGAWVLDFFGCVVLG